MGASSPAGDEDAQGHSRAHRLVADLARRALEGEDPDWLFHDATAALAEALSADYAGVFTLTEDDHLALREGVGWRDEPGPVTGPARPQMLAGPVFSEEEPVRSGGEAELVPSSDLLARHEVESQVVVPLLRDGQPRGLLGVYDTEPEAFGPEATELARSVADVIAPRVEAPSPDTLPSQTLLDRIVETVPVGILVIDADGHLEYANQYAEEILGWDTEQLEAVSYDDERWAMTDAEGSPLPPERMPFARVMEAGEPIYDMEVGLRRGDGRRAWLTVDGAPLGPGRGAVFSLTDVTERRRVEAEFAEMLERVTDAFYALDDELRFTHVNEAAEELLQRSEEELLGEKLFELYPEAAEIDEVREAFRDALEDKETTGFEVYYEPLGFWVDARLYPSETGVSVYFQDVTDRKRRERQLQESRERYRSVTEDALETSEVGTIILDDDFQVAWANRRIGEFLDLDREELLGADKAERIVAGIKDIFEDPEGFEERLLSAYEDNTYVESFECHVLPGEDRPERWLEHWSKPIETGLFEGGRIEHYYDITDRKRRERELEESQAKLRTLTENLAEVVWMSSADPYEILYINPVFEEIWRIDRETFYEDPSVFLQRVHPDDRPRVRAAYEGLPDDDYDQEYRVVQPDGEVRWVRARAVTVEDAEGEVVRIVGIAEDVTEERQFEARLAASERRHRTLVENFPNGAVALYGRDLRYTVAGGQLVEDLGLDADEIVGQSILERYPEELLEVAEPNFRAALEGESNRFEIEYHGRYLLAHTIPVRDAEGEVYAGMIVVQDITDRKRAEQRLRESEELYRTLAENFPDGGIGVFDEQLRYTLVEGTMWDDIEPDAEDLEGNTIHEALPPETADDIEPIFRDALEGEKATTVSDLGGRTYRVWATPLRGAEGHITGGLSFAVDITDQLDRQRELEESRRRYQTLVENFPNGAVALVDEDMRYRMVGGQTPAGVEASPEEIRGQPIAEAVPDELANKLIACYEDAFEGRSGSVEYVSEDRVYRFRVVPVRDEEGEIFAAMGMSQDVTEEKERERRLEESNQRLEQFAYAASHDLQEPLRMVSSYLQLIESRYGDRLDEEGREFFAYAVDGARRMRKMIKSLLAYSRVTTEGRELEPVDSQAVLEDVLNDLQLRIRETDAEITHGDLPTVLADPDQLAQVFRNLLSNALKYSGDEPPRVHVEADRTDGRWRFAVHDQGVGIAPEHTDRIFEVFRRLQRQEEEEGIGIGLAICEQIVDRHGGRMWVESEPGEGSVFSFTMPAVDED